MTETIIELTNVSKQYKETTAVKQLDLAINRGEIFGLLGPNGAGKSTTIYMMLGLTEPTKGEVHVCGVQATNYPIEVKRKVGFLPDDVGFYEDLTGLENLKLTAKLNGLSSVEAEERANELLSQVRLEEAKDKKVGKYSRGMRQRLGLADILMKDPEVVIMDEPTLGIDPKGINELLHLIKSLSVENGLTVLLSSHQLHQVQQICDRVGIFVKGELLAQGDIEKLQTELLKDHTYVYRVKVNNADSQLIEKLSMEANIEQIEEEDGFYLVRLKNEDQGELAQFMNANQYQLLSLERVSYGLDDIYQRYFQGGESIE
ncbi:ABC transporter ATP-binding protein [Salinibacillus xinjiangensis]|uniref:ATP-binding cassette domain-containing protein n=1 Tax=Salinibacillus xinjiangensis TaxID=1229268 RepID=A0A6G1X7P4_9BACI|nr:ABC transporter ATP-binding protein [Salinibacillus xinjiangensis]MRG86925.1 ATP-binding cassette domain-containing protein [Salinibacillus xinjiangensis]